MQFDSFVWGMVGVTGVALLILLFFQLTSNTRLRRRLRKNRDPIVSKSRQPSVKFSVKTPKDD